MLQILDEHLLDEKPVTKPISVMGYSIKYWAGNSVNTMEEALSEAKRFISLGDIAIKIVDPNTKTLYVSSEDVKDEQLMVTKIQYPEIEWSVQIKDFN